MSEFKQVLHEWARRQLEERSDHVGPFEIVTVRVYHESGKQWSEVTIEDALTNVQIEFRHDGGGCPDSRKRCFQAFGDPIMLDRCPDTAWSPMDSENTVTMLNQLLAIADES